jgi:hypothetical protein
MKVPSCRQAAALAAAGVSGTRSKEATPRARRGMPSKHTPPALLEHYKEISNSG